MLNKKKIKIAIVEDNLFESKSLNKYVNTICNDKVYPQLKFDIKVFATADDAIQNLEDDLDYMILDYYLINPESDEKLSGTDVLEEVREHCANCKVIVNSAQHDPGIAVQLLEKGIYEYVDKNMNSLNRIGSILQKSIKNEIRA